jgi:HPr kinase/phosphorylase
VADDRVEAVAAGGRLVVRAPEVIAGLIEVRGEAIRRVPHEALAVVGLVVLREAPSERLPTLNRNQLLIAGVELPCVAIAPRDPDPVSRLMAALALPSYDDRDGHVASQ